MKSNEINKLRNSLDKIDNKLLILIKERTALVKEIVKTKKYKNQIVDKKRINIILKNIKKKSKQKKIDPKITEKIWKNMIKAYIDFEYRNFDKK